MSPTEVEPGTSQEVTDGRPRPGHPLRESSATHSEATRRLCAAAHLDGRVRWQTLDWLAGANYRSIAASPGVDLVTVARHALDARARQLRRDRTLAAVLLATVILAALGSVVAVVLGLFIAWAIVVRERWVARYRFVGRHLTRGRFEPSVANPTLTPFWEQRLHDLREAQAGNVTVYSGGFSPFRGSGQVVGGWSFSLNLARGKNDDGRPERPQDVSVKELYGCVTERLQQLGLAGLTVADVVLVEGRSIRQDKRFLDGPVSRPRTQVGPDVIARVRDQREQAVRHYSCVQIVDWDGELVLSIFFRLTKIARRMVAEANYVQLTPLGRSVRYVDDLAATPLLGDVAKLIGRATLAAPIAFAVAPVCMFGWLGPGPVIDWAERRMVERQPAWDYGATEAIRERLAERRITHYFQRVDHEMYVKVMEREILEGIADFLDSRGIDTSELRERQATILNTGVLISGNVNAQSVAVGSGARASVVDMAKSVTAKPTR